jgi:mono/diheme cytochrome c family protein
LSFLAACKKDNKEDMNNGGNNGNNCDTTNVTFISTIKPILDSKCVSCHSGASAAAGIKLDNYDGAKFIADNGKLVKSINHQAGVAPMPGGGAAKLDDCTIAKIQKWVSNGAPNN